MIEYDLKGCEPQYRPLIAEALSKAPLVIYSSIFLANLEREIALTDLKGERSEWRHKSAKEIYDQLFPIEVYLNTYYTPKSVIGYGYKTSKNIHLNTKFLKQYKIEDALHLMKIGSNIIHEHSHKRGFEHDFYDTKDRDTSISYTLNRVYEKTYREVYGIEEAPVVVKRKRVWWKPWTWF